MDDHGPLAQDGEVRVNLAMQVAGIAAQATAAMRSGSAEKRNELASKLTLAREQLTQGNPPEGFVAFLDVMCGMLREQDVSSLAQDLPKSYRAVYDQLQDDLLHQNVDGELTVRQVLDEVMHNVILVMKRGSFDQRRMMANTLLKMQQESSHRPDLAALIDFLSAAQSLLLDEPPGPAVQRLKGPFQQYWEDILNALSE